MIDFVLVSIASHVGVKVFAVRSEPFTDITEELLRLAFGNLVGNPYSLTRMDVGVKVDKTLEQNQ